MEPIKFVDLRAQYLAYKDELARQVHEVLESTTYIMGEQLTQLETELGNYCGAQHVIGCSSGTDALLLSLLALGLERGDEVITSSFTFVSSVEVIALLGAVPVFVDIDLATALLEPSLIEAAITERTKAIIPISLFGQLPQMTEINEIAQQHRLTVIEDGAQSFGAQAAAGFSGALSKYACTSFYPAKGLGCYGDSGAVFTDSAAAATKLRQLLNHGQDARYEYIRVGINGRMDELQAAILLVKLRHYATEVARRQALAQRYEQALEGHPTITSLKLLPGNKSVYSQYSVYAPAAKRDEYRAQLKDAGVPTAVYYPKPLHQHKVFAKYAKPAGAGLLATEEAAQRIFSLPVHPFLTDAQQDRIIAALTKLN